MIRFGPYTLLSLLFLNLLSFSGAAQEKSEQEKEYQGRFWRITSNGIADTSYLYGTIHIMDAKAYRFPEGTREAFKSVDAYSMELNMDSVNQLALMSQLMMKDSLTLKDLLTEEEYKDLKAFAKDSMGLPLERFKRTHPMFLLSQFQMRSFERDSNLPLDMYFHRMAKKQGKTVIGLERMKEQVNAFHSVPYDSTAKQLVKIARGKAKKSGSGESMDKMLEAYVNGDLNKLLKVTSQQQMSGNFKKVFLVDRNERMADRATEHLKEKSLFIAIGAAHLPGKEGVIELLRDNGFELNTSGGEVKGSPDVFLEQSSTMANDVEVEFTDGTYEIPFCYYEFARLYEKPDGEMYQGFVAKSADKIFESTDRKEE
ncbi:MAG: TraB/GumN family protein [Flavobacteriales bacterium]